PSPSGQVERAAGRTQTGGRGPDRRSAALDVAVVRAGSAIDILPSAKARGFLAHAFAVLLLEQAAQHDDNKRHDPVAIMETARSGSPTSAFGGGPYYRPGGRILLGLRLRCIPRQVSSTLRAQASGDGSKSARRNPAFRA